MVLDLSRAAKYFNEISRTPNIQHEDLTDFAGDLGQDCLIRQETSLIGSGRYNL